MRTWHEADIIIPVPLQAQESTNDFVKESDLVNVWIEVCTVKSRPELYNNFTAFCDRNGESKVSSKQFNSSLGMKGFKKQTGGNRLFIGISIIPSPQILTSPPQEFNSPSGSFF